jgi:hypothetical protein
MTTTIETTVYTFAELSDSAKEKARDWYREGNADDSFWRESVYEDADTIAGLMGIEIDRKSYQTVGGGKRQEPAIYFSGFSSQGDGACFEGRYEYKKGALAAVKDHCGDEEIIRIARELQAVQRRHFYKLSAFVKHSGRYYHEMSTSIDVYKDGDDFGDTRYTRHGIGREMNQDSAGLVELLRDFMRWIYARLEAEWDYINSDESVDESIDANGYTFTESGERFG